MIGFGDVSTSELGKKLVNEAYDTGMLGGGSFIKEFEDRLKQTNQNIKWAVMVNNGTLADMVALRIALELHLQTVPGCQKEHAVIMPALTFVAQANAAIMAGVTPVFADVDPMGIMSADSAEEAYKKTSEEAEVIAWYPCDLNGFLADVRLYKNISFILAIEDACEAFGTDGAGVQGDFATYSFFASHALGIGEGGAVVSRRNYSDDLARSIINHGRMDESLEGKFSFDKYSTNAKPTNMIAACGLGAFELFERKVATRKVIYNRLAAASKISPLPPGVCPHAFPLFFRSVQERDTAMRTFWNAGIDVRPFFNFLPEIKHLIKYAKGGRFEQAKAMNAKGLYIPCHAALTEDEVQQMETVCRAVSLVLAK